MTASGLEVFTEGSGPRVVLVHGSVMGGDLCWMAQTPLAERWTLVKLNRRGFGNSPPAGGEDFEVDADQIAGLIEDGDHVVGFSYGGIVALLAAAQRPDAIASLAVLDPPAFALTKDEDSGQRAVAELADLRSRYAGDYAAWFRAFADWLGSPAPLPDPMPPPILNGARVSYHQRPPEQAVIPINELRTAPFPKLVISGDGHPTLRRVCDVLEQELNAERAYVPGVGHTLPFAGTPLNDALETFWLKSAD